jgi:hypothetical protein
MPFHSEPFVERCRPRLCHALDGSADLSPPAFKHCLCYQLLAYHSEYLWYDCLCGGSSNQERTPQGARGPARGMPLPQPFVRGLVRSELLLCLAPVAHPRTSVIRTECLPAFPTVHHLHHLQDYGESIINMTRQTSRRTSVGLAAEALLPPMPSRSGSYPGPAANMLKGRHGFGQAAGTRTVAAFSSMSSFPLENACCISMLYLIFLLTTLQRRRL